jgi:protein TonB
LKPLVLAFAGAFALHAAAAVSIAALGLPHGNGEKPAVTGQTIEIEQDPIVPIVRVREPLPVAPTSAVASRGTPHAQPVDAAPKVAAIASAAATDTVPEPVPTEAPIAPVHFAMKVSARAGTPDGNAQAAPASAQEEVVRDEDVSVRAHQVGGALPTYPAEALAQGVELSAPIAFEIVVDTSGRVTATRELRHVGYGFDEAAEAALRNYRFSPAQRGGHAVAVRMRWTVDFRLN